MTDEEIVTMANGLFAVDHCHSHDICADIGEILKFARLVAARQRSEILTLIEAYGAERYKEWKGDRTSPHYRSTYMEGMCDASDDILSHILKSVAIREQGDAT